MASEAMRRRAEENPPVEPSPWHPKYVHACHQGLWILHLRHKPGIHDPIDVQYQCNSRHHVGPCRDTWRRHLYARMTDEASVLMTCALEDAMFWTLTLDERVRAGGREAANKLLGRLWHALHVEINAMCRRWRWPPIEYFWIREAHRDGFPHLHLVVVHREFAEHLRKRDAELEPHSEVKGSDRTLAPRLWCGWAEDAGFGCRFDAQLIRSRQSLAGYASKVCAEIDDDKIVAPISEAAANDASTIVGELNKGTQVPEILPRHCRSYGYSKRFIPAREKNPEWTGWITNEHGLRLSTGRVPGKWPTFVFPRAQPAELTRAADWVDRRSSYDGAVYDADDARARWESLAHAYDAAFRRAPGQPGTVYQLKRRKLFVRNPDARIDPEPRESVKLAIGIEHDAAAVLANMARAEARRGAREARLNQRHRPLRDRDRRASPIGLGIDGRPESACMTASLTSSAAGGATEGSVEHDRRRGSNASSIVRSGSSVGAVSNADARTTNVVDRGQP